MKLKNMTELYSKNCLVAILISGVVAVLGVATAGATTYTLTTVPTAGATTSWSAATWSSTPVSSSNSALQFFNSSTTLGVASATTTYTLSNDISTPFLLNALTLSGKAITSASTTSVVLTGGALDFVSNGTSNPVITMNAANTLSYTITNNIILDADTTFAISTNNYPTYGGLILAGTLSGTGDFIKTGSGTMMTSLSSTTYAYSGDVILNNGLLYNNANFYSSGNLILNGGKLMIAGGSMSFKTLSGSGAIACANGALYLNDASVSDSSSYTAITYNGTVSSALQARVFFNSASTLTISGVIGGNNSSSAQGLYLSGGGTVYANSVYGMTLSSTLNVGINSGKLILQGTGTTLTISSVATTTSEVLCLGTNSAVTMNGGTLEFAPKGGSGSALAITAFSGSSYNGSVTTFSSGIVSNGGATIELDKGGYSSLTLTMGSATNSKAVLSRGTGGTFTIKADSGLANLGTSSGENLILIGSTTASTTLLMNPSGSIAYSIVAPWIVGQDTDTNGSYNFLTYTGTGVSGDTGFQQATYTSSYTNTFANSTATAAINITQATSLSANATAYGVRTSDTINLNGYTLTMGNGSDTSSTVSGLILNGGTITGLGKISLGTSATLFKEMDIYTNAQGGTISSTISGTATAASNIAVTVNGLGTLSLLAKNSYTGTTQINSGVLRAQEGVGMSASSHLTLNGGVYEIINASGSAAAYTYTRSLGASTINTAVSFGSSGGGFAAYNGEVDILLNNSNTTALVWGTTSSFLNDTGTLYLNSATANAKVKFTNSIDLGSANSAYYYRYVSVADNTSSTSDVAEISGNIICSYDSTSAGIHGLAKEGAGKLILSGANTYQGKTVISQGTLLVNGTHAAGAGTYEVDSGATFGGSGTITSSGGIIAESGSRITGGDLGTVGTLTLVSNVTLDSGSTYQVDIAGATIDKLAITGLLTITSGSILNINITDLTGLQFNTYYTIATYTDYTGAFTSITGLTGYTYDLKYTDTALELEIIPEPESWAMIMLGLFMLGVTVRRKLRRENCY
jgi:fibronectin-binding autotransporter adhesin